MTFVNAPIAIARSSKGLMRWSAKSGKSYKSPKCRVAKSAKLRVGVPRAMCNGRLRETTSIVRNGATTRLIKRIYFGGG